MGIEPSVNGMNVVLSRRALEELVGAGVVARSLRTLPREVVEPYETVTGVGWVPVWILDEVMRAVSATSGRTPERLAHDSARLSVESLMKGLWRVMLRFTSDDALIARTPLLYSKTYNIGRLESTFPRPGVAEVTHAGWPQISDLQLIGLAAGIEAVLRCADRSDPKVTWKRTPTGAHFAASWSR